MLMDTQVSQAVEVGSVLIPLDRETLRAPTKGVREVRFAVTNLALSLPRFERAGMELRCRMDSWQKRPNCPAAPSLADYPAQREHADYTAKNNQPADYPAWTDYTVACCCLTGYAVLAEFLADAVPLNSIRAVSRPSVPSRRERGAEDRGGVRARWWERTVKNIKEWQTSTVVIRQWLRAYAEGIESSVSVNLRKSACSSTIRSVRDVAHDSWV